MPPTTHHFGWRPDPEATEEFVAGLRWKSYAAAVARPIADDDDDRDALLYRATAKLLGLAAGERQHSRNQGPVGSCVGHGTATGGDDTTACEIVIAKQPERWAGLMAADAMYALGRDVAGRLGRGDGSTGSAAAKAMKYGTIHMLQYGDVDLTSYSAKRCKDWARAGVPSAIKEAAKPHPCQTVTRATTPEEARSAVQNGYGGNVCSGVGYSSKRDSEGFCRRSGSWAHSMAIRGYRGESSGRRGFLIQQSWGDNANSGPIWPDDQPWGSFWITWDDMARMLRSGDTFFYSNYSGFPEQTLPDFLLI